MGRHRLGTLSEVRPATTTKDDNIIGFSEWEYLPLQPWLTAESVCKGLNQCGHLGRVIITLKLTRLEVRPTIKDYGIKNYAILKKAARLTGLGYVPK